jgi:type IV secretion system protein VirD4
MGALTTSLKRFLVGASLTGSKAGSLLSHNQQLHTSRFGRLHEHAKLLIQNPQDAGTGLLLGVSHLGQIACVRPTPKRPELGNMLVCAPPRSGKSLLAISQLLTWPHSVIVNDMKGELYAATADYRRLFSDVYVIDFQGFGNCYDPLTGKTTEGELLSLATQLLYQSDPDVQGAIFRRRAAEMAMLIWQAARLEGIAPFPYLRFLTRLGPEATAARLHSVSPELATQFLYTDYLSVTKEYFSDRFFLSVWGTLTATVRPLLTEPVIRTLTRSDFTPEALMTADRPKTVYIRWREQDLVTLSALNGLYWGSWINELTSTHDQRRGKGCKPVLLLIDEGGRTAIPDLHDATSTVCGRGVSIWLAVQSLEQLAEVYHSQGKADIIMGNCDTQMFYRPNLLQTARYIEERLGRRSGYATSQTRYGGKEGSEGLSEQSVPVMEREEIMRMPPGATLVFHRDLRAMQLTQIAYSRYPVLAKRAATPAPPVKSLPPLAEIPLRTAPAAPDEEIHLDDPDTLVDPDDFN